MKDKEIAELRRRFRSDRSNATHVRGCYVNDNKEVISTFDQSLALATEEEKEKYLAIFKRTLSGTQGKNLIDITFSTKQVMGGDEHRLLMTLRDSALKDEAAVEELFQKVIRSVSLEGNYVILLTYDAYDVPWKGKDGGGLEDASETVFSYILCSICPVKTTKPALHYVAQESRFCNRNADWVIAAPELGFLFPAFDDRSTNLYNALYYNRDVKSVQEAFIEDVFHTKPHMAAEVQKQTFQTVLADALDEDCSYRVVQTVHEKLCDTIQAHKESRDTEPLLISRKEVQSVLESCGVSEKHVAAFNVQFDSQFGTDADISPRNIINTRQFELRTPDVVIHVNPERRDLVETRTIGGARYILIRAEEGVEVNGVNISMDEPE